MDDDSLEENLTEVSEGKSFRKCYGKVLFQIYLGAEGSFKCYNSRIKSNQK